MADIRMSLAFVFKFAERLLVKILGLAISIVLARLLEPDIFGLLAIISVFINLANNFMLSGFGTALVQNRTADHKDYSTVFYITLGSALVLMVVIVCIAPYVAAAYSRPELMMPLRVMALSLIPGALNVVLNAKMQRELRFKEMMYCNLGATVVAGTAGILMAMYKPSIWAMVVYQCTGTVILAAIMLPICGWYPKREFSYSRAKEYFSFGSKILASSMLSSLYADIRALIIGYRYSTADLAHYSKAQQFPETIAYTVDSSMSSVLLAALSSLQESVEDMNDFLMKTVRVSVYIVVPMMMGLAAVSETLVPLLLTEKWNRCIPLMRFFCFANIILPIGTAGLCYIKACGRSDVYLRSEIKKRVIMISILMITVFCFNSVKAIAIGAVLCTWIDAIVVICAAKYCGAPSINGYFKLTWRTYFSGLIMFLVVTLLNRINCPMLLKLCFQIVCGCCIYIGTTLLIRDTSAIDIYGKMRSVWRT